MRRFIGHLLAGVAMLLLSGLPFAADITEPIPVPKLSAHVIDQTGTLTADERARIDRKLADFEAKRGSQVVVLLVPSIGHEVIEDFATRVTDAWQLGRKGVDDGVLFVIAKQERKMRIHTGRGVQGTLTDVLSKRIVADIVAPKFRTGDFSAGIDEGTDAILKAIEGENLALPAPKQPRGKVGVVSSYSNFLWLAFLFVPVAAMLLNATVGRFVGSGLTGGATGLAAAFMFGSIPFAVFAAIAAFIFGLFVGLPSRAGSMLGGGGWGRGGGWGGGGWSGGGGLGGGGGFSGGGGGFDGGGASGDW